MMDLNAKRILLKINNENLPFEIPAQVSFFDDFEFVVDRYRIKITHEGQDFFFRHPIRAQRHFSVKPKSTKVTLRNLTFQTLDNGRYSNRQRMNLYLEFDQMTMASDFTTSILAQHYREQ